jgi:hypothetical protein
MDLFKWFEIMKRQALECVIPYSATGTGDLPHVVVEYLLIMRQLVIHISAFGLLNIG